MLPFLLIAAAIVIDRLLLSDRWSRVDRLRRNWRTWRPRTIGYVRSAPATYVYLAVLFLTSWILQTSSSRVANALLQERSTNLHHLARDPLRVLLSSAFWVGSLRDWLMWVVLVSVFAAPVERWLGTTRTVLVFLAGHVGATLVVAAGLWVALRSDLVESSVVNARDVGASYGVAALAAVLAYRIAGPRRLIYGGALIAFFTVSLALDHDFTSWGHLIAVAIGFACYPLARETRDDTKRRRQMTRYLISFDAHAMDHIPAEEIPAVSEAAHEVVRQAMDAGVWVFGGGLLDEHASIVATDGTVTDGSRPEAVGGLCVVEVPSREEALKWAAKTAEACRCAQEVRPFMPDPAVGN